jgi:hypothetical protein
MGAVGPIRDTGQTPAGSFRSPRRKGPLQPCLPMLETGSSQIVTEARPQSTPVDAQARGRRTEQPYLSGSAGDRRGSSGRSERLGVRFPWGLLLAWRDVIWRHQLSGCPGKRHRGQRFPRDRHPRLGSVSGGFELGAELGGAAPGLDHAPLSRALDPPCPAQRALPSCLPPLLRQFQAAANPLCG